MSTEQTVQTSRSGVFKEGASALMLRFSESVSFDRRLWPHDLAGSKAHAAMLAHVGLLTAAERDALHASLDEIGREIAAGRFAWDTDQEDVHMNIEAALRRRLPEAGGKLHTARSRNDQIALDMRLFFRDAAGRLAAMAERLLRAVVAVAERGQEAVLPGYTHLQRAQPVTVAHHFLAYAEMFGRDAERFRALVDKANVCPLGAGALAGSTLPIDRAFVARELGFVDAQGRPRLTANSMDAVADRDLFLEFAFACATCGVHLSRVAEDFILWSSSEFRFLRLPPPYTTGSSLMPQKRNPDACELLRGKAARLAGNLQTLLVLCKGLPLTYNRDLQEDKPPVFDSFDQTLLALEVLAAQLEHPEFAFRTEVCAAAAADPLLLATDLCDAFVRAGVPFRAAHHAVGALVARAEELGLPLDQLPDAEVLAVVPQAPADWRAVFDVRRALAAREEPGMPGPEQTKARLAAWRARLSG